MLLISVVSECTRRTHAHPRATASPRRRTGSLCVKHGCAFEERKMLNCVAEFRQKRKPWLDLLIISQWWDTTRRRLVSCAVCLEECWDLFRPLAINSAAAADCGSRDYGFHFLWRVIIGVSRNCVSVLSGNNTDYYCLLCLWIT